MRTEKYVLVRPRGGLNDLLVQIEQSRGYAARYGRSFVIDMLRSGWNCDFHRFFEPLPNFGVRLRRWTDRMVSELDGIPDVFPHEIAGRLKDYGVHCQARYFVTDEGGIPVRFELNQDYPERLLVSEQWGGGYDSLRLLHRVRFVRDVADHILGRLLMLGPDYDAVHVRHSDYQTDYRALLRRIAPCLRGRNVLLCTDSYNVQKEAPDLLVGATSIITLFDVPDNGGQPLHGIREASGLKRNLATTTDLMAMACSRRLYYSRLLGSRGRSLGCFSGFSQLAEGLRLQPALIAKLLEGGSADLYAAFLAQRAARPRYNMRALAIELYREVRDRSTRSHSRRVARRIAKAARQDQ
ncbi:hypothetical protein FJU08_01735 [Martelella alba]|uniref:Uncharacterized protein n=1 Tax=Martelella alba TaxID=2590451 RepID=A0A506UJ14_9HYPH|nr:hypothetical protein [Martelella alba]TPW33309.1 hypothetical protein FJU08_01735 [Martelella alba]